MVKPLGSVTMYFPFLDETSCEELNSMMEQTQNFWDFTTLLSEKVTTTTVSEEFVFLASILLIENGRHEFLEKISRRYSGMSSILSLILLSIAYLDESVDYDLAIEGVDRALTQDPPSWIVIHLLEVKVFVGFLKQGWSSEEDKILAQMKEIIESDEKLACFEYMTHDWQARIWNREGKTDLFIEEMKLALAVTRAHDDRLNEGNILQDIASSIMNTDTSLAKDLLTEANEIFKILGNPLSLALVRYRFGLIQRIRGEYDDALDAFLSASGTKGEMRLPTVDTMYSTTIPHDIAFLYNELGEGKNALEWVKSGMEDAESVPNSYANGLLQMIWALIHLDKLEDAQKKIDELHEFTLKTGDDMQLPLHDFAQGLIEMKEGHFETAFHSMSKALKSCIETDRMALANSCYLKLVEMELEMMRSDNYDQSIETSLSWMSKLEMHAREKDYPGIRMQHAMLKSEYQIVIGDQEAAILTLKDALTFTNEPGVRTLRKRILDNLNDVSN